MKLVALIILLVCSKLLTVYPYNLTEVIRHANDSSISFIKGSGRNIFLLENNRRHAIDPVAIKIISAAVNRIGNVSIFPDDVVLAYPLIQNDPVVVDIESQYKHPNHWSNEFSSLIHDISHKIAGLREANALKYMDIVSPNKLIGVYPTTDKDIIAFRQSLLSALEHLIDVQVFFIVAPNVEKLKENLNLSLPISRVVFVDDSMFPITTGDVYMIMEETVRKIGKYKLKSDKSSGFQDGLLKKANWYLQQLLKTYIGGEQ